MIVPVLNSKRSTDENYKYKHGDNEKKIFQNTIREFTDSKIPLLPKKARAERGRNNP